MGCIFFIFQLSSLSLQGLTLFITVNNSILEKYLENHDFKQNEEHIYFYSQNEQEIKEQKFSGHKLKIKFKIITKPFTCYLYVLI